MANQEPLAIFPLAIFPSGWQVDRVKRQILGDEPAEEVNDRPRNLLRVAEQLRNADPGSYHPKIVSFGPYWAKEGLGLELKVKVAAYFREFAVHFGDVSLDAIVAKIEASREHIASFYECPIPEGEYCKNFAFMMMVDAFFILSFILTAYNFENAVDIKCDIIKLENQIPLSILTSASRLLSLPESILVFWALNTRFSQFKINVPQVRNEEPHLLAAIHTAFSRFLRIQSAQLEKELHDFPAIVLPPKTTLLQIICDFLQVHLVENLCRIFFLSPRKRNAFPIKGYTASELARAGIKFKLVTSWDEHIWFDKYSHNLYLPRITVTNPLTEVLFRNLRAFEFNTKPPSNQYMGSFIQLMACLLDNSGDVDTLKDSDVINPFNIDDDQLVQMWKGLVHRPLSSNLQPVSTKLEPPAELKDALDDMLNKKRCMIKCRIVISKLFHEYKEQYLSKPWKVVALLVGIFILAMNTIQAYCSLWECNFSQSQKNSKIGRAKWRS